MRRLNYARRGPASEPVPWRHRLVGNGALAFLTEEVMCTRWPESDIALVRAEVRLPRAAQAWLLWAGGKLKSAPRSMRASSFAFSYGVKGGKQLRLLNIEDTRARTGFVTLSETIKEGRKTRHLSAIDLTTAELQWLLGVLDVSAPARERRAA